MRSVKLIILSVFLLGFLQSCDKKIEDYCIFCGYSGTDNLGGIPVTINPNTLPLPGSGQNTNLPSSVDLLPKFPPVENQGEYATCVAWAVGYNLKSAMDAIDKGLDQSQLSSPVNQYSPKDLFIAIPDNQKSDPQGCNYTNFDPAFTVLMNRGVATMQTVPYAGMNSCDNYQQQSGWNNEAAQHKIKSYRRIEGSVNSIKQSLASNHPVVFGATVGEPFYYYNGSGIVSSSSQVIGGGQSGGHAMVVVGYDDGMNAFRILNSWGSAWGQNGTCWVNYNFFVNSFCQQSGGYYSLFIADNGNDNSLPSQNTSVSGIDLAPWVTGDATTYNQAYTTERQINFNVYNIGTTAASPSSDWGIYYLYYNAYNANDYGIVFYDRFNTSIPQNTFDGSGNSYTFNYSIPANGSFANTVWGMNNVTRTYYMPYITGSYYLVLAADAGGVLQDINYNNNLFYTTSYPKTFQYGFSYKMDEGIEDGSNFKFENVLQPEQVYLQKNINNSAVREHNLNAYRPDEIIAFLKHKRQTGELDQKIQEFKNANQLNPGKNYNLLK